ncbi:MAPK regulated corepressor interacting protein 2-like [Glandiceps talaboti]
MYTLTKGASRLRIESRRGITQQLDNSDRDTSRRELNGHATMSSPRPTFSGAVNNKRRQNINSNASQDPVSPQHEANVRYLSEAWKRIEHELSHPRKTTEKDSGPVYYIEKSSNPNLEGFEPFDLDTWRIHQLTKDTPLSS